MFTKGLLCPHSAGKPHDAPHGAPGDMSKPGHAENAVASKCPCKSFSVSCSLFTAAEWGVLSRVQQRVQGNEGLIDKTDCGGYTMLHYAAQHGHVDICKYLISKGCDIDPHACGATPLHRACYSGAIECVKVLLDAGANPDLQDTTSSGRGDRAIHKASRGKQQEVIKLLLER